MWTYNYSNYEPELYHHGIKGMKWGVRRYQNEDGSLTKKGIKRYGYDLDVSNDKSMRNVTRIAKGEARRKYENAKMNNTDRATVNKYRKEYKDAKKKEKLAKRYDKGKELSKRGDSVYRNNSKVAVATLANVAGQKVLINGLNNSIGNLKAQGKFTPAHDRGIQKVALYGTTAMNAATLGYAIKKGRENNYLRSYHNIHYSGHGNVNYFGGKNYNKRVAESKK